MARFKENFRSLCVVSAMLAASLQTTFFFVSRSIDLFQSIVLETLIYTYSSRVLEFSIFRLILRSGFSHYFIFFLNLLCFVEKKPNATHMTRNVFCDLLYSIVFISCSCITPFRYDKPVRNGKSKKPILVQSHYENLNFDGQVDVVDDDDDDHTYLNIRTYDIPRSAATNIYDQPRVNNRTHVNNNNNNLDSDYDYPKGLIPLSARLLLNASRKHLHNCDADSLDGDQSPG